MYSYVLSDQGYRIHGDWVHLRQVQAKEVCIVHFSRLSQLQNNALIVRHVLTQSSRVVFSLGHEELDRPEVWSFIKSFSGLYGVSIKYRLAKLTDPSYAGAPVAGREGDLKVVDHFSGAIAKARAEAWPIQFIPEIEVNNDIELLGPTLMALSKHKVPWIVLGVDGQPTPRPVSKLKNCFNYLQLRGFPTVDIHFSFESEWARTWKVQTENFFSGPEEIHIDLSNKCTHSCVFCALYAPAIIEDLKINQRIDENLRKFMSATLDSEKALQLIENLPVTTRLVQFGGAGDPMLHPKAIELIALAREQGFPVEVLSNMEYFKEGDIERLTKLGGTLNFSLKFIANISAATPETYVLTRPRQSEGTFHKVINNLRKFSELRQKNKDFGARITIMCVLNRLNYHEATQLVELAKEVNAQVWFKPLEIHSRFHNQLLPTGPEKKKYYSSLKKALARAEKLEVEIFDRHFLEETLENEKGLSL